MKQIPGLKYLFSTVDDGNLSFVYGDADEVIDNRSSFFNRVEVSGENIVEMKLQHSDNIEIVSPKQAGNVFDLKRLIYTDALITNHKGLGLFLVIADCIPVIFFDSEKQVLALMHGGIANTKLEMSKKVIRRMTDKFNVKPFDIQIIIGPSLRQPNYRYGYFNEKDDDMWDGFVKKDGKDLLIDNVGATIKQIIDMGVKEKNIFDSEIDTYEDENYFSHRRDDDNEMNDQGRFGCVAMME